MRDESGPCGSQPRRSPDRPSRIQKTYFGREVPAECDEELELGEELELPAECEDDDPELPPPELELEPPEWKELEPAECEVLAAELPALFGAFPSGWRGNLLPPPSWLGFFATRGGFLFGSLGCLYGGS